MKNKMMQKLQIWTQIQITRRIQVQLHEQIRVYITLKQKIKKQLQQMI
jgi:hypothetical protein